MADIHIGKISQTEENKGDVGLTYHIPIDSPKSGIVPTPMSSIANQLQQSEIDALAAGTIVEIARDVTVLDSQSQAEITAAIKKDWQNIKTQYNKQYNFEHKFYGVTLSATA